MLSQDRRGKLRHFTARLQELNNTTPKFPGSDKSRKIPKEELKNILLQAVPHWWAKQAMMLGFDFESETFRSAPELLERTEIAEAIYESAGSPSRTKQPGLDANWASGRKKTGRRIRLALSFWEETRSQVQEQICT